MTETSTYTHQELSARLAEVERERNELAAMAGRWRESLESVRDVAAFREPYDSDVLAADKVLQETPPAALQLMHYERNQAVRDAVAKARKEWAREDDQAIREIRAEAVEAHKQHLANQHGTEGCFLVDLHEFDEYSQQLRNGGELMDGPIIICEGSHGGAGNWCEKCKFNAENHPEFEGTAYEPEGKYKLMSSDICLIPMGPDRRYWTLFCPMEQSS